MSNNTGATRVHFRELENGCFSDPNPMRFRRPMTACEIPDARFDGLWRRCVKSAVCVRADAVQADLRRRLGGPDRRFHNLHHIHDCLHRFDEVAPFLCDRDAVEVALWFHDAVYEPSDPENERRSAALFLADSAGANPVFRRRVCGLVLATRHQGPALTSDRRFIEDIDLAGFAAPWDAFMHEGELLREEFGAQPDDRYYSGQVAFLDRLKRRPWFFATEYFRERYESKAQQNLDRLLALRADQGYRPAPAQSA